MASGEKLPKTNLNLIQDIDMIDHADINAIAQAVEAARGLADNTAVNYITGSITDYVLAMPNGTRSISTGADTTGMPTGYAYTSGLILKRVAAQATIVLFHQSNGKLAINTCFSSKWSGWKELSAEPVEAVLTADMFDAGDLKIYRIGRLCVTSGFFRFTQEIPPAVNSTLGRVPVGFRPIVNTRTWSMSQGTREMVALVVQPDGMIIAHNYGANPLPINSSLTANLTWITSG